MGLGYLFFDHGKGNAVAKIPYWEAVVVETFGSLLLLFLWNLACATYRIERDAHTETKRLVSCGRINASLIDFVASRHTYSLKEADCIKVGEPVINGEVTLPAAGYLRDLKRMVISDELKPFQISAPSISRPRWSSNGETLGPSPLIRAVQV